jgi:hypothetical protein
MRGHNRLIVLFLTALVVAAATAITTLRGQGQNQPGCIKREPPKGVDTNAWPIADSTAPEPADPVKRAKRRAKGEKYKESISQLADRNETIFSHQDWEAGLSAFPVSKSDAIVIGRVLDAQAYLSNDKTGVYSEFKVSTEQVLKNDRFASLNNNSSIVVDRKGGRVRYPSGHLALYQISGQDMPRAGHRYVLFLTRDNPEQDFSLLTGYELSAGCVVSLDNPTGHPIAMQNGKDEASFLNELRSAIANPRQ